MTIVAAVASVVGVGVAVKSSRDASRAANKQGATNERISQVDVAIAKTFTADQIRQRNEQLNRDMSTAAAKFSASGVDIASGSPLLVQADILRIGMEDIEALVVNGQLDIYRAQLGGSFSRQEASATAAAARAQGLSSVAAGINQLAQNPFVINQFTSSPTTTTGTIT